jgi:hypothetical protein
LSEICNFVWNIRQFAIATCYKKYYIWILNPEKYIVMKCKIIIVFCLVAGVVSAQTATKVAWDYPVKPGTEEWKKFQSSEEMVNACQIPDAVLSSLSTEELTELCLQYPLIEYVFAFDNLNSGFDKLFSDFNGIREFYMFRTVCCTDTPKKFRPFRF